MVDSKKSVLASTPSKNRTKRVHLHDLNKSVIGAQGMDIASEDEVTGDDEMPLPELEEIINVAVKKLCPEASTTAQNLAASQGRHGSARPTSAASIEEIVNLTISKLIPVIVGSVAAVIKESSDRVLKVGRSTQAADGGAVVVGIILRNYCDRHGVLW